MQSYLYNLATDRNKGVAAGMLKVFLFILSLIYALAVRILFFVQSSKSQRLKCKVISVGNITLGGTGKTTLVEFIARYLKEHGHKVAILSRGYKRKITSDKFPTVSYENMGDEPYMLQMNLESVPVIVDKDRVRAAGRAIRDYSVDTVILDDGFQQWRLKKDLEIVAIDAVNPFGNRHLLPRGILRQGLSALKGVDVFVLTKTNLNINTGQIKDVLTKLNPQGLIAESIHEPVGFYNINHPKETLSSGSLKGKTVALFSGIGAPESFENLIAAWGVNIGLSFRFPDHHTYTKEDLDKITQGACQKNIETIITTAKDAARLLSMANLTGQLSVLVLRIALKITKNEEGFFSRLLSLYSC